MIKTAIIVAKIYCALIINTPVTLLNTLQVLTHFILNDKTTL